MKINAELIVAADEKDGIGKDGKLPWRISADMNYFKQVTTFKPDNAHQQDNIVLMGRKTWDSIPKKFRPLKERMNCVLTKSSPPPESLRLFSARLRNFTSIDNFISYAKNTHIPRPIACPDPVVYLQNFAPPKIFIIGGESIYRQTLAHPDINVEKIRLTRVFDDFDCNTFFPFSSETTKDYILDFYSEIFEDKGIQFQFQVWNKLEE